MFFYPFCEILFPSEPPKVTAPATVEVLSGSRVKLLCTIKTRAPAKVQWTMNGKTLGPVLTRIGEVNITHTIPSVTSNTEGPYSCVASNVGGTTLAVTLVAAKGR